MEYSYHSFGDASLSKWRIRGDITLEVVNMIIDRLEELQAGNGDLCRMKMWYPGCSDLSMVERAVTGGDTFVVPDPYANILSYFDAGSNGLLDAGRWRAMPSRKEAALRQIEQYRSQLENYLQRAAHGAPACDMLELQLRQKGGLPSFEGDALLIPTDSLVMAPSKARNDECWQAKYGGRIRIDFAHDLYFIEPDGEPDHMKLCGQKYQF